MTKLSERNTRGFACLFCSKDIEPNRFDPCVIDVATRFDRSDDKQRRQQFYCHIECLIEKSSIHRGNFFIAEFDNDEVM